MGYLRSLHCHCRYLWRLVLCSSWLLGLLLTASQAQVTTTITPDGTLGTTVTQNGNVFAITDGTRPGNGSNVFHSFDQFSVGRSDTARFTSDPGVENIISRVTGGAESMIDGGLESTANLFLLNPSGVIFGLGARLNVNGSFHVSTADFLRLGDGEIFHANLSEKSTLTVAPPVAFGFLRENPAGIAINESVLRVPEGETLSVIGGNIEIKGGPVFPTLSAPSGQVHIASVASAGEVIPSALDQKPGLQVNSFARLGSIDLSQNAVIDVSSTAGGGTVVIRGGRFQVDNSHIVANTLGASDGADVGIVLYVAEDAVLMNGASLISQTSGGGQAGDVQVKARQLDLRGRSFIDSTTSGTGEGGSVTVTVSDTINLANSSGIGAFATGSGDTAGDAGSVEARASNITVSGGSQITSSTMGDGKGGNVTVRVTNMLTLTVTDGAVPSGITSGTLGIGDTAGPAGTVLVEARDIVVTDGAQINSITFGAGQGGSVRVTVTNTIALAGTSRNGMISSGIFANTELAEGEKAGHAGSVEVRARNVELSGGAQIASKTLGTGQGGSVTVVATDTVSLAGTSPANGSPSVISTDALGTNAEAGDAGAVVVQAKMVTLTDGAQMASGTMGPGQGGSVTVMATDDIVLEDVSVIGTTAQGENAEAGDAGAVIVEAATMSVIGGSQIGSGTTGPGHGGHITVRATDTVSLAGVNPVDGSPGGIRTETRGTSIEAGDAGAVTVEAATVTATEGAHISSITLGPGHGGDIVVRASDTVSLSGTNPVEGSPGGIFANAQGDSLEAGDAGSVLVEATTVAVADGAQISGSTSGPGQGGNVTVRATDAVTLAGVSGIGSNAQGDSLEAGDAGSVLVEATTMTVTGGSQISSSTTGPGQGGNVTVIASDTVSLVGANPVNGSPSGIFANAQGDSLEAGDAGSVLVEATTVAVSGGAAISSSAGGLGQGGNVTVIASGTVSLVGANPVNGSPSGISSNAQGDSVEAGDAGSVLVEATTVTVNGGGQISSSTFGPGNGGSVTVRAADTVVLAGTAPDDRFPSGIFANAQGDSLEAGDAGSVLVEATTVTVSGGAAISSSTGGLGQGGNVTVRATDAVNLVGISRSGAFASGIGADTVGGSEEAGDAGTVVVESAAVNLSGGAVIGSRTSGPGQGGTIIVEAETLTLMGRSVISAQSVGTGNAGNIIIATGDMFLDDSSAVSVAANDTDGGDIEVIARGFVQLRDSDITTTVGGGPQTTGGNITLDSRFVILEDMSNIVANAFRGQGGKVRITADAFLRDATSRVSATSSSGIDGEVEIQTLTNLSETVAPLPQDFLLTALLPQRCAERWREGETSSFVLSSRPGVPADPSGMVPKSLYWLEQATASTTETEGGSRATATSKLDTQHSDDYEHFQVKRKHGREWTQTTWDWECNVWQEKREHSLRAPR